MCMLSYVGDEWSRRIPDTYPWAVPLPSVPIFGPSREEFDALKKEVEALKHLLQAAKRYDKETGQPDCQMEDKVALIRRVAELVGVDVSDVLGEAD